MASLTNFAVPEINWTTTLLALIPVVTVALGASPSARKWVWRRYYQYEVTLSVYMLNRNEKIVFNLIFFSISLLFFWATFFYLPRHLFTIYPRIVYYMFGDESDSLHGMVKNGMGALWGASQDAVAENETRAESVATAVTEAVAEAVSATLGAT